MRKLILLGLVGGSLAIPYVLMEEGRRDALTAWWNRPSSGDSDDREGQGLADLGDATDGRPIRGLDRPLGAVEVAPIRRIEEAFHFHVTPPWVLGSWPHVSTGLFDEKLYGYRVPLVTGTSDNDVSGSLTYYFSPTQKLERITLEGDTGDGRKLVHWVTTQHGLVRDFEAEQGAYVYRRRENGKVVSELRIRPDHVINASLPQQRFHISMVLTRPAAT